MKVKDLRNLSPEEIRQKAAELEKEYFELRNEKALSKLENPLQLRIVRRNLARVYTVLNAIK